MARIVAVHGIGQQYEGAELLRSSWLPALRDGVLLAGGARLGDDDLSVAFYGDLFRPQGKAAGDQFDPRDLASEWEQTLLKAWWDEGAAQDMAVPGEEALDKGRTPLFVQRALGALTRSRFFVRLSERAMIGDLKQVHAYLHDDAVRARIQSRVAAAVGADTRVVLAHSLGSVVAYEYLCAHPELHVHTLVTLGSPLGIRNLIFDRLRPAPEGGLGAWPGGVKQWVNIADQGDIVALQKSLRPAFGDRLQDVLVHNGATAHDAKPYLTEAKTGRAVLSGLEV